MSTDDFDKFLRELEWNTSIATQWDIIKMEQEKLETALKNAKNIEEKAKIKKIIKHNKKSNLISTICVGCVIVIAFILYVIFITTY